MRCKASTKFYENPSIVMRNRCIKLLVESRLHRQLSDVASLACFVAHLAVLNPENFTLSSARIYIQRTTRPYIKVINLSCPRLRLAGLPDFDGFLYAVLFCVTDSKSSCTSRVCTPFALFAILLFPPPPLPFPFPPSTSLVAKNLGRIPSILE